jgi:hypothetical protein
MRLLPRPESTRSSQRGGAAVRRPERRRAAHHVHSRNCVGAAASDPALEARGTQAIGRTDDFGHSAGSMRDDPSFLNERN